MIRTLILLVLASLAVPTVGDAQIAEWKLATSPQLTIGGATSPMTEFFRVRGAWRLSNGAIAVANGGSNEFRVFDRKGAFVAAFGRKGEGPGEFQQIGWTSHFGDTAVVYDGSSRRITTVLLSHSPRLVGTLAVTASDDRGFIIRGRLADGRWLVRADSRPDVNRRDAQRLPGYVGLIAPGATGGVAWQAQLPDMSVFVYNPNPAEKMVNVGVAAFPASFVMTAAGRTIWIGDPTTDTLVAIDATTATRRTIRLSLPARPVTKAAVDVARAGELEGARTQADRDVVELKYSTRLLPARMPSYVSLTSGLAGEIWIEAETSSRSDSTRYTVLSASGRAVARVSAAPGFRVSDIGADHVVGIHRDDDGVETVRWYSLLRRP
jgi:hypothetical protein